MNLRSPLIVVALLISPAAVNAQNTVIAPMGTPVPAPVPMAPTTTVPMAVPGPMAGPDPYAMTPQPSTTYLWGNGFKYPTGSCLRNRFWVSFDYLLWRPKGMDVVPLVTTSSSGTPIGEAGVLGAANTGILYGNGSLNDSTSSGGRFRSGWWFRDGAWALESEFFGMKTSTETYNVASDGSTILARPYYDINDGDSDALVIAYPNTVSGSVGVASNSRLRSGLLNARISVIPVGMLGCNDACDPPDRIDWLIGYRALELKDDLTISHSINSLNGASPDNTVAADAFATKNRFSGLQLGMVYRTHFRRVWMESLMRVALGNNRQEAAIQGGTRITDNGVSADYVGGLLAQRTNIGSFSRKEFTMVPELGLNFGFRLTRCLQGTIGYTIIYFPNVLRASRQIDIDVNPQLIPPEAVVSGPLRPRFRAIEDDYWAQGLNFGLEFSF